MNKFFQMDSPVMSFLSWVADCLMLSVLWMVCSVPVITLVPATAALYCVALKMARKEESGILRDFFRSFRDNFKQGIALSFLFLLIGLVLLADLQLVSAAPGLWGTVAKIVFAGLAVCFFTVAIYTVALQAQFSNTIRQTLTNAALMSIHYTLNSVVVLGLHALPLAVALAAREVFMRTLPLWICLAPAAIACICARCFRRIFDSLIQDMQ